MNDNTSPRRRRFGLAAVGDLIPVANPCHCGSAKTYPDMETDADSRRVFFVSCARCGAEGPRTLTSDTALRAWNEETDYNVS